MKKVSIIIPVKRINQYIRESIPHLLNLDYDDYEILILPDEKEELDNIRIIPTGNVGPAQKRDIGAKHAKGEILAFLDDDSYPRKDWLRNLVKHFSNEKIAAVGGPAVTPSNDNKRQKASGAVLSSFIGGGGVTYRYIPGKKVMEVDDFPTVNLSVRKDIFEKIGGFDTHYWPGEDTKLCLDIINLKYKIIYDPSVVVYHHRRELFLPHLKQIFSYSIHRGFFVKKFPKTSLRLGYFIPTFFVLFLVFGAVLSFLIPYFNYFYVFIMGLYFAMLLFTSIAKRNLLVIPGILFTHLVYGVGFVKGLSARRLKR